MGLDSHIKNFEEDFNTKLSEREKIIFGYAHSLINNKNDDIVSDNIFVIISQRNHYSLRDKCKSLAKDYGLKCDVDKLTQEIQNQQILDYVLEMIEWIEMNTNIEHDDAVKLFENDIENVKKLFSPYPETIFHDDPAKWAEMYAVRWGLLEEQELEFL